MLKNIYIYTDKDRVELQSQAGRQPFNLISTDLAADLERTKSDYRKPLTIYSAPLVMEWCFSLRYIPGKSVWGDVDRAREMVEEEMLLNYWRMRRWCGSIWKGKRRLRMQN